MHAGRNFEVVGLEKGIQKYEPGGNPAKTNNDVKKEFPSRLYFLTDYRLSIDFSNSLRKHGVDGAVSCTNLKRGSDAENRHPAVWEKLRLFSEKEHIPFREIIVIDDIKNFGIYQDNASCVLERNAGLFIPQSLTVCAINETGSVSGKTMAIQAGNDSFFLGPDNGIFDRALHHLGKPFGIKKVVVGLDRLIGKQLCFMGRKTYLHEVWDHFIIVELVNKIIHSEGIPGGLGKEVEPSKFSETLALRIQTGKHHEFYDKNEWQS